MSAVAGGDTGVIIAFCTVPSKEVAHKIAASLVESKLAACVNIIPGALAAACRVDGMAGFRGAQPCVRLRAPRARARLPAPPPGLESVYSWEGRVQTDPELLLKIKTRAALLPQLSAVVQGLHPYDTPELLAVQAAGGSEKYLNWVLDSTQAG